MNNEKYTKLFTECFESLEAFEMVAINNDFFYNGNDEYGVLILENTEDAINEEFESPYDALNSIGNYNINDEWFWVDDMGNLYSADSESELYGQFETFVLEDMAEYYYNNPSYLKDFKGMEEWYDAVENGEFDEEDEEE